MKKIALVFVVAAIMISTNLFAQRTSDIAGGKDYPLVSRFQGSYIDWYQEKNFDRYFMLSLKDNNLDKYEIDGKIVRIQYDSQKGHSVFEIYKSYENALKNARFEILLVLDKTNCGINLSEQIYDSEFNGLNALTEHNSIGNNYRDGRFTYLSAKKHIDGKDIYIVMYVTVYDVVPLITFDAIEVKSLDKDLVTVTSLETNLSKKGYLALEGIFFETGKATLTVQSNTALQNIADYLNAHKSDKFFIVGHTDNVGDFTTNMTLSENRAKAVMTELTTKFVVEANQLKAYGDANLSPITSNSTDEGKAKNRRVEIVKQ